MKELMQQNEDLDFTFILAASKRNIGELQQLEAKGVNINKQDARGNNGYDILCYASSHPIVFNYMLNYKLRLLIRQKDNITFNAILSSVHGRLSPENKLDIMFFAAPVPHMLEIVLNCYGNEIDPTKIAEAWNTPVISELTRENLKKLTDQERINIDNHSEPNMTDYDDAIIQHNNTNITTIAQRAIDNMLAKQDEEGVQLL
jgi:hypothetical protein